jgi:lactate permease
VVRLGTAELHLMTDVVSGVFSVICTALFLRFVWHPKTRFLLRSEREALAKSGGSAAATADPTSWKYPYTTAQTVHAWMPWVILILCCALWGAPAFKTFLNNLFSSATFSTTLLGSSSAARCRCLLGTCRRCTTSSSACRRSRR